MDKNSFYLRSLLRWHNFRDGFKGSFSKLEQMIMIRQRLRRITESILGRIMATEFEEGRGTTITQSYPHIFRRKAFWELVMASGTVCGIEFCYAAETAFVSPILLSLGLDVKYMTMVWCLSPLIGFFVTPLLGSLSDSCRSRFGRRRPFVVLLSIGILLGLVLVPNGYSLGVALGDTDVRNSSPAIILKGSKASVTDSPELKVTMSLLSSESRDIDIQFVNTSPTTSDANLSHSQSWSIFFTILGTVLLDFCSDACQSPSRTYLLDVTLPEDHGRGLTTFTMMAGIGGSIGYLLGAIDWGATSEGNVLEGHVKTVFIMVTVFFLFCLISTLISFPEIPLDVLKNNSEIRNYDRVKYVGQYESFNGTCTIIESKPTVEYVSTASGESKERQMIGSVMKKEGPGKEFNTTAPSPEMRSRSIEVDHFETDQPTFKHYLMSIIKMPKSLFILCLTNLFSWMSLVSYSLYFTDFVGQIVFGGNPRQAEGSESRILYDDGVRFGCFGMALFAISSAAYSFVIDKLIKKCGAKPVYIIGQLSYSLGMVIMALSRHKVVVILLSSTAGIMYSTLFTMPYLLIAHYHSEQKFDSASGNDECTKLRGMGTDVAIVSSMVFLAQFILSLIMGSIENAVNSSVVTVWNAAALSACAAFCANRVLYLGL